MIGMKKYVAAAAVVAALVGAPTVARASGSGGDPGTAPQAVAAAPAAHARTVSAAEAAHPATGVRVVKPGERVQAAPGVELWLTREGKHWSTPDVPDQFRSVVDGNIDLSRPGISLQAEPVDAAGTSTYFLSGLYYGTYDAARVEVVTADGTLAARMVTLPGHRKWGAWYATSPLPPSQGGTGGDSFLRSLRLYDARGELLVEHDLAF